MSDRAHKKKKASSSSSSSSSSSYSGILPQTECCIAPSTLALAFSPHPPLVYHDTAHIQPTNQPATHASPPQTQRAWTKPLSLVAACTGLFQTVPPPQVPEARGTNRGGETNPARPLSHGPKMQENPFPGLLGSPFFQVRSLIELFSGSTVATIHMASCQRGRWRL